MRELAEFISRDYERVLLANGGSKTKPKRKTDRAIEEAILKRGIRIDHVHKLVKHPKPIKCFTHKKNNTRYKCDTCSVFGQVVGFCHPNHSRPSRNCFANYKLHQHHQIQDP